MKSSKPTVVVFFGGPADTHDLSQETGYWTCQYLPRSKYRVVPVQVTPEGQWQVPLGGLPQQGPVRRMMELLFQAVPALPARHALERLLRHPVAAFFTTIRGQGGDDGALQQLGDTLAIPVVGSDSTTCHQTSHKNLCAERVDTIVATPYALSFKDSTPPERITEEVEECLRFPLFVKPATAEGSTGVQLVADSDTLRPAITAAQAQGDFLVQEKSPGREVTVTIVEDARGRRTILPPTLIAPHHAPFYDRLAKRRAGRVDLHTTTAPDRLLKEVQTVASALYDELGCRGHVSFDLTADKDHGVFMLEANTVPTLTTVTPLYQQLAAARLHPTQLVDGLVRRTLQ